MAWKNDTIKEFILLGLSSNPNVQILLFISFFGMYVITLMANCLIILATVVGSNLHTPMYFFLTNLSFVDIFYSTSVVPQMLRDMFAATKNILFAQCMAQMYICFSVGATECFLLAVLAYDRYIAICYPLRYATIINKAVCIKIAAATWNSGFFVPVYFVGLTMNLSYCGSNIIHHFLCEITEILSLGCGNVATGQLMLFVCGVVGQVAPISFIIITYIIIVRAIFRISSLEGRRKTFSTCSSHIIVVTLFYGPGMANYLKPRSLSSPDTGKYFTIFYTVVTPMLNPLIYTLRNKEVTFALKKFFAQCTSI
ncbi:olfactory receptor 2B6-like [Gastrophryne carolinensis]